jgi:hypothetical protein
MMRCEPREISRVMRYIYGAVGVIGVTAIVFAGHVALQRMLGVIAYAP